MTGVRADVPSVRTIFLGSGGFGRTALRRLAQHHEVELVGVVTAPARPAGRRQEPMRSVIAELAGELGVGPVLTPERLRTPESIAAVLDLGPTLLVLADYGQIVPRELLEVPHGALNLHPSLLPRHRGATPIPATILAGDAETGVTLMRMDAGLDTGPIVAQERVGLDGMETTSSLETHLEAVAADLLDQFLGPWLRGELEARPQPETGATITRRLRREDGRLDPRKPAVELERQVRAYQPWPGSFIDTPQGRLIVWSARPGTASSLATGTFDEGGLGVGHGERLELTEVQPAAGKRMPWEAFLRGHPAMIGASAIPGP